VKTPDKNNNADRLHNDNDDGADTTHHARDASVGKAWRSSAPGQGRQSTHGVALWRQIAEDLETDIETGRIAAGERLPTEAALAARFGVNRHTLRRAIAELTNKGLVEATPGRGTFVRARLAYPIGQSTKFSEVITAAGQEPGGRLLRHDRIVVPAAIRSWLGLPADAEVIELEHLRSADGVPLCLATTWFPAGRFPTMADAYQKHGTITRSLAEFGVDSYSRLKTHITCRAAITAEREELALGRGSAVLVIDSVNVDADGIPIQASHTRFAAERVQLVIEN